VFRWSIVWVVFGLFLMAWLVSGAIPALSWEEAMDRLRIRNRPRATQLAVLAVVLCALVAVDAVLRPRNRKEE